MASYRDTLWSLNFDGVQTSNVHKPLKIDHIIKVALQ